MVLPSGLDPLPIPLVADALTTDSSDGAGVAFLAVSEPIHRDLRVQLGQPLGRIVHKEVILVDEMGDRRLEGLRCCAQ